MLDHIPETPSIKHCKTYVEKWHNTQTYEETDNALHLLFIELFPNNDSMSGVLLKTSALNDFYTTNIFNTYAVAEHICKLRIDDRLRAGELKLIEEIARVELPGNRMRRFYSFASKYCSHHQPEKYAIYDSYVDEMLRYFRDADKFAEFSNNNLRQYKLFHGGHRTVPGLLSFGRIHSERYRSISLAARQRMHPPPAAERR